MKIMPVSRGLTGWLARWQPLQPLARRLNRVLLRVTTGAVGRRRLRTALAVCCCVVLTLMLLLAPESGSSNSGSDSGGERGPQTLDSRRHDCCAAGGCNGVGTRPDIVTYSLLPTLNFKADWAKNKTFWNDAMEQRFQHAKKHAHFPLKIMVVPHSHNDPGWGETFEKYFRTRSRLTLDAIVRMMPQLPHMRFMWTEISFLETWWKQATEEQRQIFSDLVRSGRLEITTGGWVMSDEAVTRVRQMASQLVEGHVWLRNTLNVSVRSGWSVDPFGHGSTMPYLLRLAGIKQAVILRTPYVWKEYLAEQQAGDFYWQQSWDSSRETSVLTHHHPYFMYTTSAACGPFGESSRVCYNFDFARDPHDPVPWYRHFTHVTDENIEERAELLLEAAGRTASLLPHNVALMMLGADFQFKYDSEWREQYGNYSRLMRHIGRNSGHHGTQVVFATPADYFATVRRRMQVLAQRTKQFNSPAKPSATQQQQQQQQVSETRAWTLHEQTVPSEPSRSYIARHALPSLVGDFHVYSDVFDGKPKYWSGYYSTGPQWKRAGRQMEALLHSTETLHAWTLANVETMYAPAAGRGSARVLDRAATAAGNRSDGDAAGGGGAAGTVRALLTHCGRLLAAARASVALFSHHDAITGTSSDTVMADFVHKLETGGEQLHAAVSGLLLLQLLDTGQLAGGRQQLRAAALEAYTPVESVKGLGKLQSPVLVDLRTDESRRLAIYNSLPLDRYVSLELLVPTDSLQQLQLVDSDGQRLPITVTSRSGSVSRVNALVPVRAMALHFFTLTTLNDAKLKTGNNSRQQRKFASRKHLISHGATGNEANNASETEVFRDFVDSSKVDTMNDEDFYDSAEVRKESVRRKSAKRSLLDNRQVLSLTSDTAVLQNSHFSLQLKLSATSELIQLRLMDKMAGAEAQNGGERHRFFSTDPHVWHFNISFGAFATQRGENGKYLFSVASDARYVSSSYSNSSYSTAAYGALFECERSSLRVAKSRLSVSARVVCGPIQLSVELVRHQRALVSQAVRLSVDTQLNGADTDTDVFMRVSTGLHTECPSDAIVRDYSSSSSSSDCRGSGFYTDANDYQMAPRVYAPAAGVAGNMYPATTQVTMQQCGTSYSRAAVTESERRRRKFGGAPPAAAAAEEWHESKPVGDGGATVCSRATLLMDRSRAVGNIGHSDADRPGSVTVTLDRRSSGDDGRGIGQPNRANTLTRSTVLLLLDQSQSRPPTAAPPSGGSGRHWPADTSAATVVESLLARQLNQPPLVLVTKPLVAAGGHGSDDGDAGGGGGVWLPKPPNSLWLIDGPLPCDWRLLQLRSVRVGGAAAGDVSGASGAGRTALLISLWRQPVSACFLPPAPLAPSLGCTPAAARTGARLAQSLGARALVPCSLTGDQPQWSRAVAGLDQLMLPQPGRIQSYLVISNVPASSPAD